MIASPYVIAAVVVFLIVLVIGSWYFSSSSKDESLEDEALADGALENNPSVEAAPNDVMDTYDTYAPETDVNDTFDTTTKTETNVNNTIVTESTNNAPTEDILNIEDVVPSEQIEFVNNKQSQIKTFLSTEFGFLNSLNV
tara:strand:- start:57 stop:476 length:420 start_codon:yes stop_codon:yes gene_type:complete